MAKARKDHRGRALRKGEIQRKDKTYMYTYTDPYGKRRYIYANDLVELREKEKRLMKDQLDGLDVYAAGNADLNFVFDRYITTKTELRRQRIAHGNLRRGRSRGRQVQDAGLLFHADVQMHVRILGDRKSVV